MTTTRGQHLLGREIGSYILERVLGYGGSSAVYLARPLMSNERVAIKVFLPRSPLEGPMRKSFYQRFLREAEAASKLDHPHILSIYSYGEHEGLPYIVMPYMPGGTLAEYLRQHGPLTLLEAQRYLDQVAAALDYAHAHGCVHCDVKPANLLLDGMGNISLSDFGIVHLLQTEAQEHESGKSAKKPGGETLMGTPDYVSPEQALGEPLDGRSDVYSLGATLYALLTGGPPFKADTPITLALMHVHEIPTPVGLLRADVTPQIDGVISKVLAKWPEERFQTAGAFSEAFTLAVEEASGEQLLTERSRPSRPSGAFPVAGQANVTIKPLRYTRINSWRVSLLLGLVFVLVLGGLFTALLFSRAAAAKHPLVTQASVTPSGPLFSSDALADDQQDWPLSSTFFFQKSTYVIQNPAALGAPALAFYSNHLYSNFHLQVAVSETKGSFNSADFYGVALRASADQSSYYLFDVTAWNNGLYGFLRYDGADHWITLAQGPVPNFQSQPGQTNVLSIEAKDDTFTLFVNGQQLRDPLHDPSGHPYLSGALGLVVEESPSVVAFSHLSIRA